MINPFKYRPSKDVGGELPDDFEDWADNPLSNFAAWFSVKILPKSWCELEGHWTGRVTLYLWADCACCHAMRFLTLGLALGLVLGVAMATVLIKLGGL